MLCLSVVHVQYLLRLTQRLKLVALKTLQLESSVETVVHPPPFPFLFKNVKMFMTIKHMMKQHVCSFPVKHHGWETGDRYFLCDRFSNICFHGLFCVKLKKFIQSLKKEK